MNPISFRSTFVVTNRNPIDVFSKFKAIAQEEQSEHGAEFNLHSKCTDYANLLFSMKGVLVAPNERDKAIESYCQQRGIKYTKFENKDYKNFEDIRKRIAPPKKGFIEVDIDSEKLQKLISQSNSNFEHCENTYNSYYKNEADKIIQSNAEIPASTLYLTSLIGSDNNDLIEYANTFGAQNVSSEHVRLDLTQKTDDPDHCMYFAMKELGMKKIPVYVNQESLALCEKLGLLE